ncbi:MAG: sugar phosphate isomerase/epimerase [Armatimonadetes bacterium]|nr:sugar phosphate isomerase/epimerase [Armatimonadota bacterium]
MDIIAASICCRGYLEDEVEGILELAPRIGYHLIELHGPMTWSVAAADAFDLASIHARIAATGLRCAGIYTPGWGGKDAGDVSERARAIADLARHAHALGGDHVTSSGAEPRGTPGALDRVGDCVGQVLERIGDLDLKLALEPHFGNTLQQPEDFARILDEFADPRVGVCVDTGHFHSAGVDTPALIRRFAPRVYNVHLKDHVGTTSVGIGRGEVDLAACVAALRDVRYAGDLTVELEVDDPQNLPLYTHEAYVYLHGLLGSKLAPRGDLS